MALTFRLTESDEEIGGKVGRAVAAGLTRALRFACPAIRARVGEVCEGLIQSTPEYNSLLGGKLLGELGIPDVEGRLREILEVIRREVDVSATAVRFAGGKLSGGLNVGILRSGYATILGLAGASYVSAPSGEEIRWLEWLIGEGDRVVVVGYDAFFDLSGPERSRSRTGLALMRRGAGWHVPPEFSGTFDDNFLTRAFDVPGVEATLAKIVREEIEMRL